MPTITKDFEEVYRKPTPKGWIWTESEIFEPYHMRVELEGTNREDCNITNIWLVDRGPVKGDDGRYPFVLVPLEGKCLDEAVEFIRNSDRLMSYLEDRIDYEFPKAEGYPISVRV